MIDITVSQSSPNKQGSSNTLAGYFIKGAQETGHEVHVLDVARMKIQPCVACFKGKDGHCVIKDDISQVERVLSGSGMVVYVTPIYFYDMSAQLKLVVDRLHCFYGSLAGKESLLLATSHRSDDEVMSYLRFIYTGLAKYLGYEDLGTILAGGCEGPQSIHESTYAAQAYQLGVSL